MRKNENVMTEKQTDTHNFRINTIHNRTVLNNDHGKFIFTKESRKVNDGKNIYAEK
ncbi:MAG: hypothetical protein FWG14_08860 [Peptococcaceae bacterium]|nr:hypothetical protein [Peptococcaceae bacterium]